MVSGISAAWGNLREDGGAVYGLAREVQRQGDRFIAVPVPMQEDSLFDIASVTKLFTCVALLQLMEAGKLRLSDSVSRFDKRFLYIGQVTVGELLSFHAPLKTAERIDLQTEAEKARELLFQIRPFSGQENRYYTDMGAMVLKYVVEAAGDLPFYGYLKAHVFDPLGMGETFSQVPKGLLHRTVCYNYERRMGAGEFLVDTDCPEGVPHDPKARVLSSNGEDLCGHAGLFSTRGDMVRFARGLLSGALLSRDTLLKIGVNRTGVPLPDGGHTQCLGWLCYAKNPVQTFSEVPACFGPRTVALSGFTGCHISMDPERSQFMLFLGNRVHNRVTCYTGRANPYETATSVLWNDGRRYPLSQNFVFRQDACLKAPVGELLGELEEG